MNENVNTNRIVNPLYQIKRDSKIKIGETIRSMTNVHPLAEYKSYNKNSAVISRIYFPDSEKKYLRDLGIIVDIDIDCEEALKLLVNSSEFFYDYNNNKIMDTGEFAFTVHIFASKNGKKNTRSLRMCYS